MCVIRTTIGNAVSEAGDERSMDTMRVTGSGSGQTSLQDVVNHPPPVVRHIRLFMNDREERGETVKMRGRRVTGVCVRRLLPSPTVMSNTCDTTTYLTEAETCSPTDVLREPTGKHPAIGAILLLGNHFLVIQVHVHRLTDRTNGPV